jgi:hypothetical protein
MVVGYLYCLVEIRWIGLALDEVYLRFSLFLLEIDICSLKTGLRYFEDDYTKANLCLRKG